MDVNDFLPGAETLAKIRRDIIAYEQDRRAVHRSVRWRMPLFVGLTLVAVGLLAWGFNSVADANEQWTSAPHVFLYFAGFVALLLAVSAAGAPARALQKRFRADLLPKVFSFIGDLRYAQGHTPASFEALPRQATGEFNRERFDDVFSGVHAGFPFELYEAELSQKAGKIESTQFRGVITSFHLEQPFPGLLVATRKGNQMVSFFKGLFGSSALDSVDSGVADLDRDYDFRTDNVDAARPLVQGDLARALAWLAQSWPEEPARVALHAADGFLLLPTSKNFFELPPVSVPLDYDAHIRPLIADMATLLATAGLVRRIGSGAA